MPSLPEINYLVEGVTDAAIARTLIRVGGATPGIERVMGGKSKLVADLSKYNAAAAHYPWLAIRDMDHDAACAPALRAQNLPSSNELMCFRIAVRETEAWLLADREAFASAIGVPFAQVPIQPETLEDPKLTIVNLARKSRKRAVKIGLVPEQGAGISIGPEYAAWIIEFAHTQWDPTRAVADGNAPSLSRTLRAIKGLIKTAKQKFDADEPKP
ncbi:hypothetical protein [Bradyrhizobium sp. USDA 3240]